MRSAKRRRTRNAFALCVALGLTACSPRRAPVDAYVPPAPTGAVCPPDSSLTHESFAAGFFDAYCQRCHGSTVTGGDRNGAPSNRTYDDAAMIRRWAQEIDQAAAAGPNAINRAMPPRSPIPTELERRQLGEWLACGAP